MTLRLLPRVRRTVIESYSSMTQMCRRRGAEAVGLFFCSLDMSQPNGTQTFCYHFPSGSQPMWQRHEPARRDSSRHCDSHGTPTSQAPWASPMRSWGSCASNLSSSILQNASPVVICSDQLSRFGLWYASQRTLFCRSRSICLCSLVRLHLSSPRSLSLDPKAGC